MFTYPVIDPVAISLGPLTVHWYGLMYLFGFAAAWAIGVYRARQPWSVIQPKQVEDLVFYAAMGLVIGARVGYVMFYNFPAFLEDPIWLFRVWEGGMSFHGGLLGVLFAMFLFSKKIKQSFLRIMDFVVVLAPTGLFCGRMGNFIGQELWGRPTTSAWGIEFPNDPGVFRHPSQLYEAFLEGIVLFIILFVFSRKPRPAAAVGAVFLIFYGIFRFSVEFVREPDAHIQFDLFDWMTRGQILSAPMVIIGLIFLVGAYAKYNKTKV